MGIIGNNENNDFHDNQCLTECLQFRQYEPDTCMSSAAMQPAQQSTTIPFTSGGELLPVSDCSSDCMVCHEVVDPSILLDWLILTASHLDMRPATPDPSSPSFLAADDASVQQLAAGTYVLYRSSNFGRASFCSSGSRA